MPPSKAIVTELKQILDHASHSERLDGHPWVQSLSVAQRITLDSSLQKKSPGYQLLATLTSLFRETMPSLPPRRGKRPDTRWGQFGILTALYFAPFEFSTVHPASLTDAWGRIDQVIPLFVFGKAGEDLPETEGARYRLISDEAEAAPTSTLSDWHIKGLERLAYLFLSRETHLSRQLGRPSVVLEAISPNAYTEALTSPTVASHAPAARSFATSRVQSTLHFYHRHKRQLWIGLAVLLLILSLWKIVRVTTLALSIRSNVTTLRGLVGGDTDLKTLASAAPQLSTLRQDFNALRWEVAPILWLGRLLGWVPVYGPDLAAAGDLLAIADGMVTAANEVSMGLEPLLQAQAGGQEMSRSSMVDVLVGAQPHLTIAHSAAEEAVAARARVEAEHLSPRIQNLLLDTLDPALTLLQSGTGLALAAPKLLGAPDYGPQTYLILLQNEDELRATGGFITAVGAMTLDRGEPIAFTIEESYAVDDLNQPYLPAPWQLDRYMASHIWLLRDSNWSPHFPDAAALAEHAYAYTRFHAVDGVIALDQEAIRLILEASGPIQLADEPEPITAANFVQHIRAAKDPSFCSGLLPEERQDCKVFLRPMATALIERLKAESVDWPHLLRAMFKALTERHILIQMDDPTAAAALTSEGWDGAVQPGNGDYLMGVESNIGFNKVNAAVTVAYEYTVDLFDLAAPTAQLTISHYNPSPSPAGCIPGPDYGTGDYADLIERCYWDYLRVYTRADTELLGATPHAVPADWMLRKEAVPAQVDELDALNGAGGVGTLLVVPGGERLTTQFDFALSPQVIRKAGTEHIYKLKIQKQPGTLAVPLTLIIRLPPNVTTVSSSPLGILEDHTWRAELSLRTNIAVTITFR